MLYVREFYILSQFITYEDTNRRYSAKLDVAE